MIILLNTSDLLISLLPIFIPYVLPVFCLTIVISIPCIIRYLVRLR